MTKTLRNGLIATGVLVLGVWLVKYFSETEMRRLDKEVDRLCAIDGRSVIYETVKLPASKFNSYGQPMVPDNNTDDTGFGYFIQFDERTLAGPGQAPGARLLRTQLQVIRTADRKVIAEHIYYTRGGGYWLEGVPGVGHGKACPGPVPMDFEKRIFIKE
jgi:hypothetical protein